MNNRTVRFTHRSMVVFLVAVLLAGLTLGAAPAPRLQSAQAASALPDGLLKADGTLNTSSGVSAALDLRGWRVRLDARRGPVLQPAVNPQAVSASSLWSPLGSGTNGYVNAIAVSGNDVYVGGEFTSAGSCTSADGCKYIAKWNGSVWSPLGTGADGRVNALAVIDSDVYAGGSFSNMGNCKSADGCKYIARWNGSSWFPLGTGMDAWVGALAVSGSDLYVGGAFGNAGGVPHTTRIARWDGHSTWFPLGTGGILGGYVLAIAVSGSNVYIGGQNIGGPGAECNGCSNIGKWDGSGWSALGTGTNDMVYAIAASGSDVYVGGQFTSAGGVANTARIAKWNGSTWSALGTGIGDSVQAITIQGSNVYVGGVINWAGTCAYADGCVEIARWNGSTWSALGTGVSGVAVYAIAISGSNVYAGGSFTSAGTCTSATGCKNIARWGAPVGFSLFLPLVMR